MAAAKLALADAATINPNMSATSVQKICEQSHAE
jgi:hypothetical protein